MTPPLNTIQSYWFVLPLVVAISLVYAASRHENWSLILRHALRLCLSILGLLVITIVVLLLINRWV